MTVAAICELQITELPVSKSETKERRFELTDLGNAERLVHLYGEEIRYCPARRRWLVWSDEEKRWLWDCGAGLQMIAKRVIWSIYQQTQKVDAQQAKTFAKHAADTQRAARIHAMLNLASNEPGVQTELASLDANS